MRMRNGVWILIVWGAVCLPANIAGQEKDQTGPPGQPTAPVVSAQSAQVPGEGQAPQIPSDPRSFSGAEEFSARPPATSHSYFLPSFQFSEMGDSNFAINGGPQRFETINTFMGRLDFKKVERHSVTTLEFIGGGSIYNHHSELNSTSEQFGIAHSYQGRRWSFLLDDRATYLPESPYGYGGFGFAGALGPDLGGANGSNLSNLNPAFSSTETLLTGRGSRILNTVVGQVQYKAGLHSAITLAASYGLLHFQSSSLIDSRTGYIQAGYSHSFTARDNLGINYGYNRIRYTHLPQALDAHQLQLTYGHRFSGRLAMEVGAGPQIIIISHPLSGSDTAHSWSAHSSLNYQYRKQAVAVSYDRGTNNGGGVLTGAITDNVRMAWSTDFARHYSFSLGPGYAHNRSLSQTTAGNTELTFNTAYAGASLSRRFGRNTSMFFTYNYQNQRSNIIPCATGNCASGLHRHVLSVGFDFHPRQISMD
jgi:hypothetical protein